MPPEVALLKSTSDYNQDIDNLLRSIIMGVVTTTDDLRSATASLAEEHQRRYTKVRKRLKKRMAHHFQTGEYTDMMIVGIPTELKSALGLNVESH